jgi:hypothetical protein
VLTARPVPGPAGFTDLDGVPVELAAYVRETAELGVLVLRPASASFNPNQPLTRREFARWLFLTYNRLYQNNAAQQLREAGPASPPSFQDVPATDPDFKFIQGLAEAGVIPSVLGGQTAAVAFRPDQPLTRATLLQWKVPLDVQGELPPASVNTVAKVWGFRDTPKIEPAALPAVLADFPNGEQSNIRRGFGFTLLLQPQKTVTRAEAASVLWSFGPASKAQTARLALGRETTTVPLPPKP